MVENRIKAKKKKKKITINKETWLETMCKPYNQTSQYYAITLKTQNKTKYSFTCNFKKVMKYKKCLRKYAWRCSSFKFDGRIVGIPGTNDFVVLQRDLRALFSPVPASGVTASVFSLVNVSAEISSFAVNNMESKKTRSNTIKSTWWTTSQGKFSWNVCGLNKNRKNCVTERHQQRQRQQNKQF